MQNIYTTSDLYKIKKKIEDPPEVCTPKSRRVRSMLNLLCKGNYYI